MSEREFAPTVQLSPPPNDLLMSAIAAVTEMTKNLPSDARGGIVMVGTTAGFNAAIVHRCDDHFEIGAWVGKNWGDQITGAGYVKTSW